MFGSRGCPAHDLRLSPDHAIYVNGALVPARYLINGITIVLAAEGLLAESYLDTGNRDELRYSGASQNSAVKYDKPA